MMQQYGSAQSWWLRILCGVIGFCIVLSQTTAMAESKVDSPVFSVTQDRFTRQARLNISMRNERIEQNGGKLQQKIAFYLYTNYPDYVSKYQVTIYAKEDLENKYPLKSIVPQQVSPYEPVLWDGILADGTVIQPDKKYKYLLEVFDAQNHRDVTVPKFFEVYQFVSELNPQQMPSNMTDIAMLIPGFGIDNTAQRGIIPQGDMFILQGRGLKMGDQATINGAPVTVDGNGSFVRELILPPGRHDFTAVLKDSQNKVKFSKTDSVTIADPTIGGVDQKKDDVFMVGIVDVTVGKNSFRGHIDPVAQDDHYNGKVYTDGRIAFYLKGKVKGKYLVTAQLDTGEDGIGKIFKQINEKDPKRVFREIDPDKYYPVYGDDSTLLNDVDTQGKFYLRVEWDKSYALWGNYNTQMTGTELAQYNRSLYGLKLYQESVEETKFGDTKSLATAFVSNGQTRQDHNEFTSTGGSLYYLKHQRVTEGSEKIMLQVRDKDSDRLLSSATMTAGADYEIDAYQGRITLHAPLALKAAADTIISNDLRNGNKLMLVADYEYYDESLTLGSQPSGGVRAYQWLNDSVKVGTTYVKETRDDSNYTLFGVDATLKSFKGTYTNLEYATSNQVQLPGYKSTDGGLTFANINNLGGLQSGTAYKFEQVIDFRELTTDQLPMTFKSYYIFRQKGFSSLAQDTLNDTKEYGVTVQYNNKNNSGSWLIKNSTYTEQNQLNEKTTTVQLKNNLNPDLKSTVEVRYRNSNDASNLEKDVVGAVQVDYNASAKTNLYVAQQATLSKDEATPRNNKTTLGVNTQVNDKLQANVEGFVGDLGNGGSLGLSAKVSEKSNLYTKFNSDIDRTSGRTHTATFGGNYQMNDQTNLYSERQFQSTGIDASTADVFGVKYLPDTKRSYDFSYAVSQVENTVDATSYVGTNLTRRQTGAIGFSYHDDRQQAATRFEVRNDQGSERKVQYVTTNNLKYIKDNQITWFGKYDYSVTDNRTSHSDDAKYTEASIGVAYRPVKLDKLNLLAKYTFLQDLGPTSQSIAIVDDNNNLTTRDNNTEERSRVLALEGIYDLSSKFSLGAKWAMKNGWMRVRGSDDGWVSAGTTLAIGRMNYHLNKQWDALAEYRWLKADTAQDTRQGYLLGAYRHLNKNLLLGIGYNFTDFNDDLTNLNYNVRGWFVNMAGTW